MARQNDFKERKSGVPDYETIIFEKKGAVAKITLNRPKVLNAFNQKLIGEFLDVIDRIAADETLRAVVITGSGRSFCSGDDLKESGPPPAEMAGWSRPRVVRQRQGKLMEAIRALPKPVIAAINGFAHGAGSDLALACDFRIASETARLGDIRTSRAIATVTGAPYFLPRIVGLAKTIELLFTGDTMDAKEAERIGLVNKTVPPEQLENTVMEMATKLAAGPTKAIGLAKIQIYEELSMNIHQAMEHMCETWEKTPIEDMEEGRQSFREKRAPRFTGR